MIYVNSVVITKVFKSRKILLVKSRRDFVNPKGLPSFYKQFNNVFNTFKSFIDVKYSDNMKVCLKDF